MVGLAVAPKMALCKMEPIFFSRLTLTRVLLSTVVDLLTWIMCESEDWEMHIIWKSEGVHDITTTCKLSNHQHYHYPLVDPRVFYLLLKVSMGKSLVPLKNDSVAILGFHGHYPHSWDWLQDMSTHFWASVHNSVSCLTRRHNSVLCGCFARRMQGWSVHHLWECCVIVWRTIGVLWISRFAI